MSDAGGDVSTRTVPAGGMAPRGLDDIIPDSPVALSDLVSDSIVIDESAIADNWASAAKTKGTREKLEAFLVAAKWLVDTGCGKDLLPRRIADLYDDFWERVEAMIFGTANGPAEARDALPICIA